MDEVNKKLAEWAGFTQKDYNVPSPLGGIALMFQGWLSPKGEKLHGRFPIFTESLDACERWLMPKLHQVTIIWEFNNQCYAEVVIQPEYEYIHYKEWAETPALALCLAIEKLIDGEK